MKHVFRKYALMIEVVVVAVLVILAIGMGILMFGKCDSGEKAGAEAIEIGAAPAEATSVGAPAGSN